MSDCDVLPNGTRSRRARCDPSLCSYLIPAIILLVVFLHTACGWRGRLSAELVALSETEKSPSIAPTPKGPGQAGIKKQAQSTTSTSQRRSS